MSLILDGSNGVSDIDGSASTPAIRGTDANTGIFFPAADTIAFAEGGVESMRIDSSGNVGIGTSSPSFTAGGGLMIQNGTQANLRLDHFLNGGFEIQSVSSTLRFYSTAASAERMRITSGGDLQFNSGYGSVATAYGCRAWVNFNGTGTVAIRASGNVSSITDNGTGFYDVNFTNAMPDLNYAVGGLMQPTVTNNGSDTFANLGASSASSVRLNHYEDGVARDSNWVSCIIFR